MLDRIDTAGKSLWQLIEERAALTPDVEMLVDMQGATLTYGEFKDRAERAAAGFAALGVTEGTPVSWILPSRKEAFVLTAALARLGAVQNPILPIYREREVGFMARQTKCELLVVPGTFRDFDYEAMAKAATEGLDTTVLVTDPDLPDGDPSTLGPPASNEGNPVRWVMYTSGTIADPEGRAAHRRDAVGREHVDARGDADLVGRQRRGRVPDHPRRRPAVDVQHDGERGATAARRDLHAGHHHPVPPEVRRDLRRAPAPRSISRTSTRSATSPTCRSSPRCASSTAAAHPSPPPCTTS